MDKLRILKSKIISKLTKELNDENFDHISQLENERDILLKKMEKGNINPLNYFKINYCNFKDGFIKTIKLFWPMLTALIIEILMFLYDRLSISSVYGTLESVGVLLLISIFGICSVIPFFQFLAIKGKIETGNHIDKINNKIEHIKKRLMENEILKNLFENNKEFNKNAYFEIDQDKCKKVNLYGRYIDVEMIREIEKALSKEEIIRLMQKSKGGEIKYSNLIELIIELDNNESAIENYKKVFSFLPNVNKKEFKKYKEKELVF